MLRGDGASEAGERENVEQKKEWITSEKIMRNNSHVGGGVTERSSLLQIEVITCNYCAPFHSMHAIIM